MQSALEKSAPLEGYPDISDPLQVVAEEFQEFNFECLIETQRKKISVEFEICFFLTGKLYRLGRLSKYP